MLTIQTRQWSVFADKGGGVGVASREHSSEMVSQHAMATTVRKVKQENRLRRQNQNQGTEISGTRTREVSIIRELWALENSDFLKFADFYGAHIEILNDFFLLLFGGLVWKFPVNGNVCFPIFLPILKTIVKIKKYTWEKWTIFSIIFKNL